MMLFISSTNMVVLIIIFDYAVVIDYHQQCYQLSQSQRNPIPEEPYPKEIPSQRMHYHIVIFINHLKYINIKMSLIIIVNFSVVIVKV